MTRRHELSAPDSAYVGVEHIEARRLDSLAPELLGDASRVLLKLDVQGAELRALSGAEASLRRILVVEMELSLVPLYEGGALMREALDRLDAAGYDLVGLEPGFSDPSSGRLLQADGLFARRGRDGRSADDVRHALASASLPPRASRPRGAREPQARRRPG